MTEQEWITTVASDAVKACKILGGYLPSVLIAQTCLETGYGQGSGCESLVLYHNLLGMKTDLLNDTWESEYWSGRSWVKRTPEWDGEKTIYIRDSFRIYDNNLQCMCDYLQFMRDAKYGNGTYKYRDVLTYTDQYDLINTVSGRGYCTDPGYAPSIMKIITKHNLSQYDKEGTMVKPTTVSEWLGRFGKTLVDRIAVNRNKGQVHNINTHKYLAIHYLGVNGENPDLYDGCYGGHFYVSKTGQCYQAADVGDRLWHVGAGNCYKYLHDDARNANTIGIEVATFTASGHNNDNETWYYTEASQVSLAQLVAGICMVYGIPLTNVLMHGNITSKLCPMPYIRDAKKGSNWSFGELKAKVLEYLNDTYTETNTATATTTTTVLRYGHTGDSVVALQENLISLGYSCGSSGADGIFGYDTENAVQNFQEDHDLAVDGLAGPITLEAIRNAVDSAVEKVQTGTAGKEKYFVQVGAYGVKANATKMLQKVEEKGFDGTIKDYGKNAKKGTRYHVQCGAFVSKEYADALCVKLDKAGFDITIADA